MRGLLSKLRGVLGLAATQLRHYRLPTALAVVGVALAVLLLVLLTGLGLGVMTTGTEGLAWLDQDLWISAGPIEVAPGAVGGVQNPLLDAHGTAREIEARDDVQHAEALSFQFVYVSPNASEFVTLVGVGGTGNSSQISVRDGPGFSTADVHYANGSYDGPMSHEVIIDERTAQQLDVSVGDTLYIGGTLATARENAFTVVGISPTFTTFLGTATVTLRLSELQTVTGTTGTDPASLITVTVAPGADVETVEASLERQYPEYSVRTNQEQLEHVVGTQARVIASAVTLVLLSIVVGAALVVNVLALLVYHQREALAALRASGVSSRSLFGLVVGQGLAIGALGGLIGVLATPPAASGANQVTKAVIGWTLVSDPPWLMAAGFGFAVVMGGAGAAIAGWHVLRLRPLEHLD